MLHSGLLQPPLPGSEEEWRLATGHRPEHSQPLCRLPEVQDGDYAVHPVYDLTGRLVYICGSAGRIPTHPHQCQTQTLAAVHGGRPSVPVQGATLRPDHVPVRLHQGCQDCRCLRSLPGTVPHPVPGRLGPVLSHIHGMPMVDGVAGEVVGVSGALAQSGEVRLDSGPDIRVPGDPLRPHPVPRSTDGCSGGQVSATGQGVPVTGLPDSKDLASVTRTHVVSGETDSTRSSLPTTIAVPAGVRKSTTPSNWCL